MTNEVAISQEQAAMIDAGMQTAIDLLLETGNFQPTLYLHDGERMTFYTLLVQDLEKRYATARQTIQQLVPEAVSYALLYDSAVETKDGQIDVLNIETGDADDDEAHEFARMYSRPQQTVSPKMMRLGPAPHLLK